MVMLCLIAPGFCGVSRGRYSGKGIDTIPEIRIPVWIICKKEVRT